MLACSSDARHVNRRVYRAPFVEFREKTSQSWRRAGELEAAARASGVGYRRHAVPSERHEEGGDARHRGEKAEG